MPQNQKMSFRKLPAIPMLALLASWAVSPLFAADAVHREAPAMTAFIVAHPDDWQLFMGDVAVARVAAGDPVVFVYLTAGGADRPAGYWQAREAGSAAAVDAAASRDSAGPLEKRRDVCRDVSVLKHAIRRCAYRNTVSYYLRLPDGAYDGSGFSPSRFQSLNRFASGDIDGIAAVDASAEYRDWGDLVRTVDQLLAGEMEQSAAGSMEIHSHDPDTAGNPGDHSDHRNTARLAAEIAARRQLAITGYAGYAISTRPANLSAAQAAAKMLVFLSYDRQRLLVNGAWSAYGEEPAAYSSWLFRTYGRRLDPTKPCSTDCRP
jgi:hypothetical protein